MKHQITLLAAMLVAACATTPPPVFEPTAISVAKGKNTATIFLNRADAPILGHATASIIFNGKSVGEIKNGQCVRLSVPAGSHNLHASKASIFGQVGDSIGHSIAQSFNHFNVKIKPGQSLHYFAKPEYDSPNVGWIFRTIQKQAGRTC